MQQIPGSVNFALRTIFCRSLNTYSIQKAYFKLTSYSRTLSTFTDSPVWVGKMKTGFSSLDLNKDGFADDRDVAQIAKSIAKYKTEDPAFEQECYEQLKKSTCYGIVAKGVTADEYVEGMKKFVSLPDAKERIKQTADMIFSVIDVNQDGVITFEELSNYGKTVALMDDDMVDLIDVYEASDLNKDGVVDPDEFRIMYEKMYLTDEM